ncbi:MAG: Hsp20/alpha crystallin family protein [Armatimonadetes bacterium]|nr:Hsp20/alpha crystallin family protein [Armatimonadota bacterium]
MFKEYDDLIKQMEFEMQRSSAEAMRRLLELPPDVREFWLPKADVYETPEDLVVRVEVAGVRKESLNVSLSADNRTLSVTGTRSERYVDDRAKLRYYRLEVYFGSFERDVLLPADISVDRNRLGATYRDGFLIVTLPKSDDVPASRYIPIEEQSDE